MYGEMTIKMKFVAWRGLGIGGTRKIVPNTVCCFSWNIHDNDFFLGRFANPVRPYPLKLGRG